MTLTPAYPGCRRKRIRDRDGVVSRVQLGLLELRLILQRSRSVWRSAKRDEDEALVASSNLPGRLDGHRDE